MSGRIAAGVSLFVLAALGWLIFLGWIFHQVAAVDAARYKA